MEPTYGLTVGDQPGLLRSAQDPLGSVQISHTWSDTHAHVRAIVDKKTWTYAQSLHTLHVTGEMLCLQHEVTCLMAVELRPSPPSPRV